MIPLIMGKSHMEQDQVNRPVVPVRWCSSRPEAAGCTAYSVPLPFRHAQIFGDNLSNYVLFYVQSTCNHLNSQLKIATYHLHYQLDVDLSPACRKPSALEVIFHLTILFQPLMPLKAHVHYIVLSPYACWSISSAWDEIFSNRTKNW